MSAPASRIRDRLAALDRERFTGRHDVLPIVDGALAGTGSTVLLVHGVGGIGKSALLREIARRATDLRRPVHVIDGRTSTSDLVDIEHRLEEAFEQPAPVILLDALEHAPSLERAMREHVVPRLAAGAVVVLAGRDRPETAWLGEGWEHVARIVELRSLHADEITQLLAHHGVRDAARVEAITDWSRGLPLAVTVAATAEATDPRSLTDLDAMILHRLADRSLDELDRRLLDLASVAVAVDAAMVEGVLGRPDASSAVRALADTTIAESIGGRVALHDTVRRARRRQLAGQAPARHQLLVGQVADHLRDRIAAGESELLVELAELIEDPVVRWGLVGERERYHVDRVRPGDEDEVAVVLADRPGWAGHRRFLREAPEVVTIARDRTGAIAGFSIAVTPDRAPACALDDDVLGPWLADARRRVPDGDVILWRTECDVESLRSPDARSSVTAVLNEAVVRTCGLPNPRWFYGVVDHENQAMVDLSAAMGAVHVPELDVVVDGQRVSVHVLDHGVGGFLTTVHRLVHEAIGLPTPTPAPTSLAETVDLVLRHFHDDGILATSALGRGSSTASRAAAARATVFDAVDRAFGDDERDRLLHDVLHRGYLVPGASHASAARVLHMSRATYFRRLRSARERLVAALEHDRPGR